MNRAALAFPALTLVLAACGGGPPPAPPVPDTVVVRDTVVLTREVPPPLPEGQVAMICLANGQSVDVRVSAAGDTLIGPRRVRMADLGPGVGFMGNYAAGEPWFVTDEAITLDRRQFSKFGQPETRDCRSMKIIGDFQGVNLFAEVSAAAPFRILYVPVRPGVFQPYQTQVGRVRG